MMNIISLILMMIFPVYGQDSSVNEHVKLEFAVSAKVSSTVQGTIAMTFNPSDGIHINTDPAIELVLEKKSPFELVGKPSFKKNDKGYLLSSSPVEFNFKAKNGTAPGKQIVKGKLNYFYCSDKEGWCNRYTQPVEITIVVTK